MEVESGCRHVWAISYSYYPVFSGAAIQAQRLYEALSSQGFCFTVLTALRAEKSKYPPVEIKDGVTIRRLPVLSDWRYVGFLKGCWRFLRDLSFFLRCVILIFANRSEIDVLHLHGFYGFTSFLLPVAKWLGIPTLMKMTKMKRLSVSDQSNIKRHIFMRFKKECIACADRVVVLSDVMLRQYVDSGLDKDRLVTIPQGVNTDVFHPVDEVERRRLRHCLGLSPDCFFVAFVGSIIPRKGVDILIDAFINLAQNYSKLMLFLIGEHTFDDLYEGGMSHSIFVNELRSLVEQNGMAKRVVWTGRIEPEDVAFHLKAADIFCFPSRLEGVPSALLEAMACGLPVIASHLDGTSNAIMTHGEEGFIVSTNRAEEFERYIERFLKNPSLINEMGLRAYRNINDHFSFNRAVSDYYRLYYELIFDSKREI